MSRFYSNGDLFVDLSQVSCVCFESAVIGGVLVKLSESAAFDLRRQVRAYKESTDKKTDRFNSSVAHGFLMLTWVADVIGNRLKRRDEAKKIPTNNGLEVLESGATTQ